LRNIRKDSMPKIKKVSQNCGVPVKSQTISPKAPDPTYEVTKFLSWLKKRGAVRKLNECKKKWENEGLNIESIIKLLSPYLCKYTYKSEAVVNLEDKVWADQWMSHYNLEVPHHRHKKAIEKIISDTEKKTKV